MVTFTLLFLKYLLFIIELYFFTLDFQGREMRNIILVIFRETSWQRGDVSGIDNVLTLQRPTN